MKSNFYFNLMILVSLFLIREMISIKWIHAVGKDGKGDDIAVSLMNEQITTKAMLRPQKWFFNVMSKKPSIRYIKEAEENGLKYQIELLKEKMEEKYNDAIRDLNDQKLINTEIKSRNKLLNRKSKQEIIPYPADNKLFVEKNILRLNNVYS